MKAIRCNMKLCNCNNDLNEKKNHLMDGDYLFISINMLVYI